MYLDLQSEYYHLSLHLFPNPYCAIDRCRLSLQPIDFRSPRGFAISLQAPPRRRLQILHAEHALRGSRSSQKRQKAMPSLCLRHCYFLPLLVF